MQIINNTMGLVSTPGVFFAHAEGGAGWVTSVYVFRISPLWNFFFAFLVGWFVGAVFDCLAS